MKFDQPPGDNEKIKQEILQESIKADPTQSSLLANNLNLEKVKEFSITNAKKATVYEDKKTGEIFYHKNEDPNLKYEYFVTLLSKGILHVSDIVEKEGMLLSREIDLDKIKEKSSKEEIEAEFFLLGYLFDDRDHDSRLKHNYRKKNGKFASFDYGMAFNQKNNGHQISYSESGSYPKKENINSEIKSTVSGNWLSDFKSIFNIENVSGPFRFLSQEKFLQEVLNKTDQYLTQLKDYSFFDNVINKTNMDIFSDHFPFLKKEEPNERKRELYNIMMQRLFSLKEIVTEKLKKN